MRLTVATIVAALSVYAGKASPLAPGGSGQPMELTPGTFPIVPLDTTTSTPNVTHPANLDSRQVEEPAILLLCESPSCVNCFGYDLSHSPPHECLTPGIPIRSAFILPASDTTDIPYSVYIGPAGCDALFRLSRTNTCYNVESIEPLGSYARTD